MSGLGPASGHNLSPFDTDQTVNYGTTSVEVDSTFVYCYFHGTFTYYKYLAKYQKSNMVLKLSS